tara:strand:- start:2757 stop:2996 length:240 start_codon:yes stop_codon:yes gene_type:complete
MIDPNTLTEFGVAGFAVGCIVATSRWFLVALEKKDRLIGRIVEKNEEQRERSEERHDISFRKLSDAIFALTKEIARKKD